MDGSLEHNTWKLWAQYQQLYIFYNDTTDQHIIATKKKPPKKHGYSNQQTFNIIKDFIYLPEVKSRT